MRLWPSGLGKYTQLLFEMVCFTHHVRFDIRDRRRRTIFELVMCFLVHALFVALHYIVQGSRYDIVNNINHICLYSRHIPRLFMLASPCGTSSDASHVLFPSPATSIGAVTIPINLAINYPELLLPTSYYTACHSGHWACFLCLFGCGEEAKKEYGKVVAKTKDLFQRVSDPDDKNVLPSYHRSVPRSLRLSALQTINIKGSASVIADRLHSPTSGRPQVFLHCISLSPRAYKVVREWEEKQEAVRAPANLRVQRSAISLSASRRRLKSTTHINPSLMTSSSSSIPILPFTSASWNVQAVLVVHSHFGVDTLCAYSASPPAFRDAVRARDAYSALP
ncbi:hypothetical protein BDZ89DRAFT_1173532 [Hymenopellis radicata]|nr:hypothetical protein BDZ89DRAFT_1173532 [Hymenopellis radicata]